MNDIVPKIGFEPLKLLLVLGRTVLTFTMIARLLDADVFQC